MTPMESKRERRGHFRGKARPGRRVEVRFRVLDNGHLSEEQRAFTKNIGVGGAFICTASPPPPGSSLLVMLQVPASARPLEVRGEIRWILDGRHDEDPAEHGMGIRFHSLDVDQLMALNEYFASLTTTADIDEV
jgi:uncharacterized protein (TIGR02266 family)